MSRSKNSSKKQGQLHKSWQHEVGDDYSDETMVITRGSNRMSTTPGAGSDTVSGVVPGREEDRLEKLRIAVLQLQDRHNSHNHHAKTQEGTKSHGAVSTRLPARTLPCSSVQFWYALRASVNGRTEEEEKRFVHELHLKAKDLINRVAEFKLELVETCQWGCTVDYLIRFLEHTSRKPRQISRNAAFGRLRILHPGAAGLIPKPVASAFISLKRTLRNPKKSADLVIFIKACREIVPACAWQSALDIWTSHRRSDSAPIETLMSLSVEAKVERLLNELDEVEEAYKIIHARQARLTGCRYGQVHTQHDSDRSTVVKGMASLAAHHEEYLMLDPEYLPIGKARNISVAFATNYNVLRTWLASARAIRVRTAEMRDMLQNARNEWCVRIHACT
jgi:hypothetical protein